ncbi:hypothetical protein CR513_29571, partial [Mucuna pruriens]
MTHAMPWYADIYNFLVASTYPLGASQAAKEKLANDAKYYIWDSPYLWRICMIRVNLGHSSQGHICSNVLRCKRLIGLLNRGGRIWTQQEL